VVEVSVVKDDKEAPAAAGDVVVRPFIVREKVVLQPGYSIEYEVRFQNLAGNCGCAARVKVVSAESIVDSR